MKASSTSTAKPAFRSRIITILAGAAAVAYALFVFVPAQQSIADQRRQIQDKQLQISKTDLLAQPLRQLEEQVAETHRFTQSWRQQAPRPNTLSSVFAEVIRQAKETGAEVMSITPQAEQPLETIGLVPVALQAEGSYRSLHELIERLEKMQGTLWVDDLQLEPHAGEGKRLHCSLKVIIFADRSEISG